MGDRTDDGRNLPLEGRTVWMVRALNRLGDSVSRCQCTASVFYDPDDPGRRCWNCVDVPTRPPLLHVPGGTVVLADGVNITSHHLHRDRKHDIVIGMVESSSHQTGRSSVAERRTGQLGHDT